MLCAIAEDVEVRVPRRRARGSRLTRGLLATTVAATVLGVTGVAAAEPGGTGSLAFWTAQPGQSHVEAADRSIGEAQQSLLAGNRTEATQALDEADKELLRASQSSRAALLKRRSTELRGQANSKTPRPLPSTESSPTWHWSWGIPGGGPGWQPKGKCLLILCTSTSTAKPTVQKTPGASTSTEERPGLLFRRPSTATPTTPGAPGLPSPSSPNSPSATPVLPTSPTTTKPSPSETDASSPSDDGSDENSPSGRPSASPTP